MRPKHPFDYLLRLLYLTYVHMSMHTVPARRLPAFPNGLGARRSGENQRRMGKFYIIIKIVLKDDNQEKPFPILGLVGTVNGQFWVNSGISRGKYRREQAIPSPKIHPNRLQSPPMTYYERFRTFISNPSSISFYQIHFSSKLALRRSQNQLLGSIVSRKSTFSNFFVVVEIPRHFKM